MIGLSDTRYDRLQIQGARLRMARAGRPGPEISMAAWATMVYDKIPAAERAGLKINRNTVSNWESGRKDVKGSILRAVAELGGVSTEWLLGDRDTPGFNDPWYGLPLSESLEQGYLNLFDSELLTAAGF